MTPAAANGIWPVPVEVVEAIPFRDDRKHAAYDADAAQRCFRVLEQADRVLKEMREFVLPYEALRAAPDPDEALLAFLQSTYDAAADLAGWDRKALERRGEGRWPPHGS